MAFRLELSAVSDGPVVVIYTAMDGSAISGSDFQRNAGVLTIEAGTKTAEVTVPLIDDDLPEPDEEFRLFLSVDPKVVATGDRNILATIRDNDT